MTDTLPSNPSPDVGIERESKPNLLVAGFGDGYSQRTALGLNQTTLKTNLTWTNLITSEKVIIDEFFLAHNRGESWYWQMPDEDEPRLWYVDTWKVTYVKYGVYNITASIVEAFDIV